MGSYFALNSVRRRYWELVAHGVTPTDAGRLVGMSERCGQTWFRDAGGMNPQFKIPSGRLRPRLSIAEREEIMIGTARRESIRSIARRLGRAPSTIMRDIDLNGRGHDGMGRYRALHRFGANRGGWDAKSAYRVSIA